MKSVYEKLYSSSEDKSGNITLYVQQKSEIRSAVSDDQDSNKSVDLPDESGELDNNAGKFGDFY